MKVFAAMLLLLLLPLWSCAPGPLERAGRNVDNAVKDVSDGVKDARDDIKRKH